MSWTLQCRALHAPTQLAPMCVPTSHHITLVALFEPISGKQQATAHEDPTVIQYLHDRANAMCQV